MGRLYLAQRSSCIGLHSPAFACIHMNAGHRWNADWFTHNCLGWWRKTSFTAHPSLCSIIILLATLCLNAWVPFTRVHLGQRAGRPAQGRSQNTQQQTRQKRRTTDAGPRTTAPRKRSIPTTTEQLQPLGRRPHGRLLLNDFSLARA